jgi:hypothetical protein
MSCVLSHLNQILIWGLLRLGSGGWMLDAGGWREARNGESLEMIGVAGWEFRNLKPLKVGY